MDCRDAGAQFEGLDGEGCRADAGAACKLEVLRDCVRLIEVGESAREVGFSDREEEGGYVAAVGYYMDMSVLVACFQGV